MSEQPLHPIDALHDAVSGRLDGAARADLDRHLAGCESCRQELALLSSLRAALAPAADAAVPVPVDLEARLRRALDDEDRAAAGATTTPHRPSRGWLGWAAAAAALAAVALMWVTLGRGEPAPVEVAQDLRRYAAGTLPVDTPTGDIATLEARLGRADFDFPTRVFDFGAMAFELAGGGVHRVAGRPSALFVYNGPDSLRLLCEMYAGSVADLPEPDDRRTNDGIEFLVYRQGDVTVVFWQERDGRVVCALAANGDPETAVRFAFAKAIGG
ncbi:MAG: zf-HC2 domain-containing protein [Vicinamibacterales bacterium]